MYLTKKISLFIAFVMCIFLIVVLGKKISLMYASQQPPIIPVRDFFRNPEKASYDISPDGTHLSYLAPYQNRLNIFVQQLDQEKAQRITSATERDIYQYFWKNNNTLLYLQDNKGDENFHLYGINKDGSNLRDFTPFNGVRVDIVDKLEDDDEHILIVMNDRDKKAHDVYRLNVTTGQLNEIARNPGNIISWGTDHEGKLRIAVASDGVNRSILYRDNESEPFRTILSTDFKDSASSAFFTFDNKQLYVISNMNRDKRAIVIFDPKSQKETQLMYEHPEFDISSLNFSRKRKVLTDIEYFSSKRERILLDAQTANMFSRLEQALKGYEIYRIAHSKNEDKYIVRTMSDRTPGAYYLYDVPADKLTKLADIKPWLKEEYLASVKPIQYISRDGLTIHGYLTLPLGKEAKNLPAIIIPHGGPWLRDTWTYNPEIQFLANRGYAVLQMNFRGSTGYGKKFWQASFKQWGRAMQNDLTDGVKWLIKQSIADPKRIAIYGGSYGGYATLAGLTFTPDLYACGIDYVGISNLFTFFKSIPEYWKPYLETLYEEVGHPEKDKELLTQVSPVFHADNIKAPLFIAQGRMDPRVNINESDQMVEALKKRGIDVLYMVKDNEGHGFSNEENQFDFYEAMEKFLAQYL